jgi:hypothetical protein
MLPILTRFLEKRAKKKWVFFKKEPDTWSEKFMSGPEWIGRGPGFIA